MRMCDGGKRGENVVLLAGGEGEEEQDEGAQIDEQQEAALQ